jgi:hypothetical protein
MKADGSTDYYYQEMLLQNALQQRELVLKQIELTAARLKETTKLLEQGMDFRHLASRCYGNPLDSNKISYPAPLDVSPLKRMQEFSRLEPFCQSSIGSLGLSLLQSGTLPPSCWPGVSEQNTLPCQEDEPLTSENIDSVLSEIPEELRLCLQAATDLESSLNLTLILPMMRLSSSSPMPSTPDSSFTPPPTPTMATEVYSSPPPYSSPPYSSPPYSSPPLLSRMLSDTSISKGESPLKKKRHGRFPCLYPGCNKDFTAKFSVKRHAKKHLEEKLKNSPRVKPISIRQGEELDSLLVERSKNEKVPEDRPSTPADLGFPSAWGA